MTDPAAFLRRHPEIVVEKFGPAMDDYLQKSAFNIEDFAAAVLPAILAAHEADLAGDAREVAKEIGYSTAVQECCNRPHVGKNGEAECCGCPDVQFVFTADTEDRIATALAAAYLAGRRAGREEAAKVGDEMMQKIEIAFNLMNASPEDRTTSDFDLACIMVSAAREMLAAIRSLP